MSHLDSGVVFHLALLRQKPLSMELEVMIGFRRINL